VLRSSVANVVQLYRAHCVAVPSSMLFVRSFVLKIVTLTKSAGMIDTYSYIEFGDCSVVEESITEAPSSFMSKPFVVLTTPMCMCEIC